MHIRHQVRRSIEDVMRVDVESFCYDTRGEPPYLLRLAKYEDLDLPWEPEKVRFL